MRTGSVVGICVALTTLSGCLGGAQNETIPPELACLQRTDAVMLELAANQPETAEEGLEYVQAMISVIDGIEKEGCSDETVGNLAEMRDSAQSMLALMEVFRTTGGTPEQNTQIQSITTRAQAAGDAIDSELIRREREFEGR